MLDPRLDFLYVLDQPGRNWTDSGEQELASREPALGRPKVLVVDDERLIADTMSEILEDDGFHVKVAYDGWSALESASQFRPDYLLTDVMMPRMNGVELAIAIRRMLPATKILLFSGQAGISNILLEGQKQGFNFELAPKPMHPLKLIEKLRNVDR